MKIIIFGATYGVGYFIVKQAVENDFEVMVFVRTPAKPEVSHEYLNVMQDDTFNPAEVLPNHWS